MISLRVSGSSEQVDAALLALTQILNIHGMSEPARPAPFVIRIDLTATLRPLNLRKETPR